MRFDGSGPLSWCCAMHPDLLAFLIIVLVVGGAAFVVGLTQWLPERARRRALGQLARRLGMRYALSDPSVAARYDSLSVLGDDPHAVATNVLVGTYRGHRLCAFDFYPLGRQILCYKSRREAPAFTVFVLEQEQRFPRLRIYPETAASKLAQALGYEDIDFESVEFSEAFCVRSPDRKFAFDVCHPRMMTYLLRHRDMIVEFADDCIALCLDAHPPERHRVEAIPYWLKRLITIRKLLPGYLFEQQEGGRRAVESAGQNP